MNKIQLNEEIASGKKFLVIFTVDWCGESLMTRKHILPKLKETFPNLILHEVDIDENNLWNESKIKIMEAPTFFLFSNKSIIKRWDGYKNNEELIKEIKHSLNE